VIDPTDLVRETDEDNNTHELRVQVVAPINN
jgi:subtilase family serine protease